MAARDLTAGSIPLLIGQLALPVLAALALQSAYQLVDLYFVGMLGGAALAAQSITLNTFFLTFGLGFLVGTGALALMSQAFGRGSHGELPALLQQAAWLAMLCGAALWAAGVLGARPFLAFFSADPAVVATGVPFFRVHAATLFTQLLGLVAGMCFRAVGDFLTPTLLLALGVVLNAGLDPLLMFGWGAWPGLGLPGAAWATLLAQLVTLAGTVWLLTRPRAALRLRGPWRWHGEIAAAMLRIGAPAGLLALLSVTTLALTFLVVRPFGADATAAVGVGFRIVETGVLPLAAIATAVSSMVGQNYGAGRLRRVRGAILWGVALGASVGLVEVGALLARPALWLAPFTDDAGVQAVGVQYLRILGPMLVLVGPGLVVEHSGGGLGRTFLPMLGQALRLGSFLAGLALLVYGWELGLAGVFWSRTLSVVVEALALGAVVAYWWVTVLRVPAAAPDAVRAETAPEST